MAENHTHDPKYSENNAHKEIQGLTIKAGESLRIDDKNQKGQLHLSSCI